MSKKVITLHELEILWSEFQQSKNGITIKPEYPFELLPAYSSYCRRSWTVWTLQKEKRINQLAQMDLLDSVLIDYYINTKPIRPI